MFNLTDVKIDINAWYRGLKSITISDIKKNKISLSNGDRMVQDGQKIQLNGELLADIEGLTEHDLIDLYKWNLERRGYKLL